MKMNTKLILFFLISLFTFKLNAQIGDCPYPVIFVHGWVSDDTYWEPTTKNSDFNAVWGNFAGTFHAVLNATDTHERDLLNNITLKNDDLFGPDGIFNDDGQNDDVQWIFPNENNVLNAGCIYAINWNNGIKANGDLETYSLFNDSPCLSCSDSNESGIMKQGYALKQAISAVLAANPTKDKVLLVGHSMGGLGSREYLQRLDASSNPRWWVDPSLADGHKVVKLVTVGTPHRGSNSFGNVSFSKEPSLSLDVSFDLRSEGVRDLRYSYAAASGPDVAGAYLFGGDEADIPDYFPWYWSEDVNCDGDEDDTVIGINNAGSPRAWDGTTDNPSMPLPLNVRYTYYVSNLLAAGGDGVVEDDRQWIYNGGDGITNSDYANGTSIPVPNDGVDYRLSDRVDGSFGVNHSGQMADVNKLMHAIDEGDYPKFAWKINMDHTYAGMAQVKPTFTPNDGNRLGDKDRDWYQFELLSPTNGLTIKVKPNSSLSGRIDFYENPSDYELNDALVSLSFSSGTTTEQVLKAASCDFPAGIYYVRVSHDNVGETDWKDAFTIRVESHNVVIPTSPGLYTATNETTDRNGWTHYWMEASNPANEDLLLLSLQKDATMMLAPNQVQLGIGGTSPVDLNSAAYVPNGLIWYVMNRYWDASPTVQPAASIPVRFYYTASEFSALQTMVQSVGGTMPTRAEMIAYKFDASGNVDPDPNTGHLAGTTGNFITMGHSTMLCNGIEYAEFAAPNFSGGGLGGTMENQLPVELIHFNLEKKQTGILLKWLAANEDNFDKYIIERSKDGLFFEDIGSVLSLNEFGESYYSFLDRQPKEGVNYYRLKMLDIDGSLMYSEVLTVDWLSKGFSYQIAPNPIRKILNIEFLLNNRESVSIQFFNVHGQEIMSKYLELSRGENQVQLNTENLAAGVYYLKIARNNEFYTQKIIK